MIYLALFWSFIKIGLFSIGGGYAILAMIQQEVVIGQAWLSNSEFFDIVAISQMTPGPIAINAATFIGFKKAGISGALVATLGVILPAIILMTTITVSYLILKKQPWFKHLFQRLRPLSIGLIASAAIIAGREAITDFFAVIVFLICFAVTWKFKANPFLLLLVSGFAGYFLG